MPNQDQPRPVVADPGPRTSVSPHAFEALDGIRGIAALAVLVYHAPDLLGSVQLLPRAYLAVDLFFLLSGFVLSHAYHGRLAAGLSTLAFMQLRVERLFPAYALGLCIVLPGFMIALAMGSHIFASMDALLWSLPFAVLLLPTPAALSQTTALYPLNPAAWSIFFELVANFVFAAAFAMLRKPLLILLIIVGASTLAVQAAMVGSLDVGNDWAGFGGGLARVFFSFVVGIGLHRLHRTKRLPIAAPWWLSFGIVVASFIPAASLAHGFAYDACCVLVVYPLVVAATANTRTTTRRLSASFGLLGAWSYPLYILHTPLLFVLTGSMVRLFGLPVAATRPWGGIAILALIVVIVAGAERWVERPILRRLRARRSTTRAGMPMSHAVEAEAR